MNENPREPQLDEEYRPGVTMEGSVVYDDSEKILGGGGYTFARDCIKNENNNGESTNTRKQY